MTTAVKSYPPLCDSEAEASALAALLMSDVIAAAYFLELGLRPTDFYRERHRIVCNAIYALWAENQAADVITVCDWLSARDQLAPAGGRAGIDEIAMSVPAIGSVRTYVRIIKDLAVRRSLQDHAWQLLADADQPGELSGSDLVVRARGDLDDLGNDATGRLDVGVMDAMLEMTAEYDRRLSGAANPVRAGYAELDGILKGGLLPGSLYLIAARPGMGKTAVGLGMAGNILESGKRACLYNLEMDRVQIAERLSAARAGVPLDSILSPDTSALDEAQLRRWHTAAGELSNMPLRIVDRSVRLAELCSHARYLHARGELDVLIIDYLQLVAPDERASDRYREVTDLSLGLKRLASDLKIPVIAMAQLNREVERRTDKRPTLSDLRDSGQLEQDAQAVLLLYRNDYYSGDDESPASSVVEVHVAKNRGGATGVVELELHLPTQRVSSRTTR